MKYQLLIKLTRIGSLLCLYLLTVYFLFKYDFDTLYEFTEVKKVISLFKDNPLFCLIILLLIVIYATSTLKLKGRGQPEPINGYLQLLFKTMSIIFLLSSLLLFLIRLEVWFLITLILGVTTVFLGIYLHGYRII